MNKEYVACLSTLFDTLPVILHSMCVHKECAGE